MGMDTWEWIRVQWVTLLCVCWHSVWGVWAATIRLAWHLGWLWMTKWHIIDHVAWELAFNGAHAAATCKRSRFTGLLEWCTHMAQGRE